MRIPQKNKNYIHKIILDLIILKEDLKLLLQTEFPESHADFNSAADNPNCSCVSRIEKLILNNQEKVTDLLEKYLEDKNDDKTIINIINTDYTLMDPVDLSGKMFIIDNNEKSFSEFVDSYLKNKYVLYRGFSTSIDISNKLYIYFI